MNFFSFCLLTVSIIFHNGAGALKSKTKVRGNEFKYIVTIQERKKHLCAGTILSENYILTAAHCVSGRYPKLLRIVAGSLKLCPWYPKIKRIKWILLHQNYRRFRGSTPEDIEERKPFWAENDLAILRLRKPLSFSSKIGHIDLPTSDITFNSLCKFAGWGEKSTGRGMQSKLHSTVLIPQSLEIKSTKICFPRDTEFYAWSADNCTAVMHGDSGGPLVCNNKLAGIASASSFSVTGPAVFVNIWKYMDFIKNAMT